MILHHHLRSSEGCCGPLRQIKRHIGYKLFEEFFAAMKMNDIDYGKRRIQKKNIQIALVIAGHEPRDWC